MKLRDLPLVSLRTFAVVADCGSVTAAAEALGVTHSAVSKQVKQLERWLGQPLYLLEGRRLVLTPFGTLLSSKLGAALDDIAGACAYVQRQRGRRTITVEAPATFAMYWLLPRVSAFRAREPQTDVWVSTRMTGQSPNLAGHDLVIVRGEAAPTSTRLSERVFLLREDMTVLSSPKLLASKPLAKPADVTRHALIESMTRPQDWQAWLQQANVGNAIVAGGHRFDHLFVAIQAVKDGLGSLVAPRNLLQLAIASQELACPFPHLNFPGEAYFAYLAGGSIDPAMTRFRDWLVQEGQSQTAPGDAPVAPKRARPRRRAT
ncbi:LysR family transcriptional regulator [Bradyrhizobium sp. U87765 SZCCT0131]|nr:LysR family transcriptional regulator [Bradyrhizobium sp. U87765 SZCCT0131]MBR1259263.1 LysR family transcriptional regulator [Bradyrhizobium sp. U87765 SZCCT0134]MBR1350156.1 LysR family transcriptional regulator [Bradyrhizobium sp. U87765 SZCCT0048]